MENLEYIQFLTEMADSHWEKYCQFGKGNDKSLCSVSIDFSIRKNIFKDKNERNTTLGREPLSSIVKHNIALP